MRLGIVPAAMAAMSIAASAGQALAAPTEKALYSFTGNADGGFPHGGVIADASGTLYGTASNGGTGHAGVVFQLTPPANGKKKWKQSTLYSFTGGNDGGQPYAALLRDSSGALYGTTLSGGASGNGVVYKLTPPAKGKTQWTQSVLWTFSGGNDGGAPWSTLIADAGGTLYGTTTQGGTGVVGTVFALTPPAQGKTAWTETVLYNFTGNNDGGQPFGSVLLAADGSLYGTSAGYGQYNLGTVYQLTPPKSGGSWGFNLVHAFTGGTDGEVPRDGLIADSAGTLYGTTAGFANSQGTVFKITASGGQNPSWNLQTLFTVTGQGFTGNGPYQTVALDSAGALYGTTYATGRTAYGEVFKLTPPAAGKTAWKSKVLHAFKAGKGSQYPYSTVLVGPGGTLFGTTYGSAGQSGYYPGNVWEITQ